MTSGSAQAGLAIGKSAGEGVVYAKDLSRPMVFTVESALADELKKPADDFRVKDLFDARSFNTTRIEIVAQRPDDGVREGQGRLEAGRRPAAKAADTAKVEALLTALTNARATGFVDKTSDRRSTRPSSPSPIKFEDGKKQEKVAFAPQGTGRVRPPRRRCRRREDRRHRARRHRQGARRAEVA